MKKGSNSFIALFLSFCPFEENNHGDERIEDHPDDNGLVVGGDEDSCREIYQCEPCDKLEFQVLYVT